MTAWYDLVQQITGLNTTWRRPKYVFGIDGRQALHVAMQCAGAMLDSAKTSKCRKGITAAGKT